MAIKTEIGGIRLSDVHFVTVLPCEKVLELTMGGLAFEQDATGSKEFDHLDERVHQLQPARGSIQRTFYNVILKDRVVRDPETGEKRTAKVKGFGPSAKYRNATGDLLKYVKGPFIDSPHEGTAALPSIIVYFPEQLEGKQREGFDAGMGGEFYIFDMTGIGKAMIADGESRMLAIERALQGSGQGALPGQRKERLKNKLLTVEVYHGISPLEMGQIFADVNGKGVGMNSNEATARDIRDPWSLATKKIFENLAIPLVTTGRQVSRAQQAEGKHLLLNQAKQMVRGVGLGTHTKAVSSSDLHEGVDFDRVVSAGTKWIGEVVEHFGGPEVFTDPDRVLRAMPVKVALGLMGNAWYDINLELQMQHRASLETIQWRVGRAWNGVAGKVTGDDEAGYKLAASGAKEVGSRAARALTNPGSKEGKLVRPG